jgi:hypothetical protein
MSLTARSGAATCAWSSCFAPGEQHWINNRWILHNRTAFEDYAAPERRRHYVRLWLRKGPEHTAGAS